MKLKAGHRYIRRDGKETGPLARTGLPSRPFKDNQSMMHYDKNGRISDQYEFPQDLVKELTTPIKGDR